MALVTCPTSSIGTTHKIDAKAAARAFPEPIAPGVYFCGWAAGASFGAAAWLVQRPDGNVLVDSPRAAATLMDRLAELGGVRYVSSTIARPFATRSPAPASHSERSTVAR